MGTYFRSDFGSEAALFQNYFGQTCYYCYYSRNLIVRVIAKELTRIR